MDKRVFLGLDVGSTTAKLALVAADGKPLEISGLTIVSFEDVLQEYKDWYSSDHRRSAGRCPRKFGRQDHEFGSGCRRFDFFAREV